MLALDFSVNAVSEFINGNFISVFLLHSINRTICESIIVKVLIECDRMYSVRLVIIRNEAQLHPAFLISEDWLETQTLLYSAKFLFF